MWLGLLLLIHYVFASAIEYNDFLNYQCETDSNCTKFLSNSICYNKKCICQFGHRANQCIVEKGESRYRRQINYGMRMLGEECDWTNQCRRTPVDGTKICSAHICQCSDGYVPMDAFRCIRDFEVLSTNTQVTKSYEDESPGYGSACSTNKDCRHVSVHLECIRGNCACLDGFVPLGKYLCYNMRSQGESVMESSTVSSDLSSTTLIDYPISNEVMKSLGKLGNSCTNDYFCRRTVSQSHCYNGKCMCIDGYLSIDQYTCMKNMNEDTTTKSTPIPADYKSLLGGNCLSKRNCHTSIAVCLNSICSCPDDYFPVDDWTCLQEPESSDEESVETTSIITKATKTTTTTTFPTTTVFRWWPWSPTPTTHPTFLDSQNTFRVRCLLNRQCASMDKNSHCTLFGRCICNRDYQLETSKSGQRCVSRRIREDDCD